MIIACSIKYLHYLIIYPDYILCVRNVHVYVRITYPTSYLICYTLDTYTTCMISMKLSAGFFIMSQKGIQFYYDFVFQAWCCGTGH